MPDPAKIKDIAGIVFGFTAFLLSLIALLRSSTSDQRARDLAYASEKQLALVLLFEEELTVRGSLAKVTRTLKEAKEVGATDAIGPLTEVYDYLGTRNDTLIQVREGFAHYPATGARHRDLVSLREGAIAQLQQMKAERLAPDEGLEFLLSEAARSIELHKEARRRGISLEDSQSA